MDAKKDPSIVRRYNATHRAEEVLDIKVKNSSENFLHSELTIVICLDVRNYNCVCCLPFSIPISSLQQAKKCVTLFWKRTSFSFIILYGNLKKKEHVNFLDHTAKTHENN